MSDFWLHIHNTQPEEGLALARLAEEVGFAGVLGDDHWFMPAASDNHDPDEPAPLPMDYVFPDFFAFGAAVMAQTNLRFGSCIMVLANRANPFLVAKSAATLARMSGDRFILGVGIGWMRDEFEIAGIPWESRVPRTVEMIEILRKLWGPGPVEHHGRFFDFPATYANPRPEQPVPLYMGGLAPAALRRIGTIADGWMGHSCTLADLPDQIALINEGREQAERLHEPFAIMAGLARNTGGALPVLDDYRRAQDLCVTHHHVRPIDHRLGKLYSDFDEKRRVVEEFGAQIIARY